MKKIAFPSVDSGSTKVRWDQYNRFYTHPNYERSFVLFDTGELIITANNHWRESHRGVFENLGLQIARIYDPHLKGYKFFLDGKPTPKAWIDGSQTLLLDLPQQRVYAIGGTPLNNDQRVPPRLGSQATVYYQHYDRPPVASPVRLNTPDTLTKEEKRVVNTALIEIKAAHKLGAYNTVTATAPATKPVTQSEYYGPPLKERDLLDDRWRYALQPSQKTHIATFGVKVGIIHTDHPHLTFTN